MLANKALPQFAALDKICSEKWSPSYNELEAVVSGNLINRINFRKAMADTMRQWSKGKIKEEPEVLDISMATQKGTTLRYSIEGLSNIAQYCKTNKLSGMASISAQSKKTIERLEFPDYGFKIKLSEERPEQIPPNLSADLSQSLKLFRLKKRYSVMAAHNAYRIDFTIVRSGVAKNLATAQLQQEKEKYEIEVEFVGKDEQPDAMHLLHITEGILCSIKDEVHLLGSHAKVQVVDFYTQLVQKERTFIGPKPVTLEHQNLVDIYNTSQVPLLQSGYAVTEKADGDRALLIFDEVGEAYLLNNRFEVKSTRIYNKAAHSSILDVEVVKRHDGSMLILAFDCYWIKKVHCYDKHLTARLTKAKEIVDGCASSASSASSIKAASSSYAIRCKEMLFATNGPDIFSLTKTLLDRIGQAHYDYKTDGLIYTPIKCAVGETTAYSMPSLGGTWPLVFKWKEPRDNTIDMLVKEIEPANAGVKSFLVQVGDTRASVEAYFEGRSKNKNDNYNKAFVPVVFRPPGAPSRMDVPIDSAGLVKCANGDEIRNNYIVEIAYDADTSSWKPLRIRYDKIDESNKKGGKFTANALNPTANSVWRTITVPVTTDQICGKTKVTMADIASFVSQDDAYYVGKGDRTRSKMFHMAEFHNYWVKNRSLLQHFKGHATSLFDVACGVGGDLFKWFDNGFTTVVGVDISEAGINGKDGAYQRLMEHHGIRIPDFKYVFVPLDSGKIWHTQIEDIKDEYLKTVARVMWGQDEKSPTQAIKHLEKIATQPTFNVVSCQFALHYFFESDAKLDAFITNVNSVLAPGGYFVGTCFDGDAVAQLFESSSSNSSSSNSNSSSKNTSATITATNNSWSITKSWTGKHKQTCGQAIDVFIETINQTHREYLVSFSLLQQRLKPYKIRLLTPAECTTLGFKESMGTFEDLFKEMEEDTNNNNNNHVKNALKMDTDERTLSFLNRWFVFFKEYPKAKRVVVKKSATAIAAAAAAAKSTTTATTTTTTNDV